MSDSPEPPARPFPLQEIAAAIGAGSDVEDGLARLIERFGRDLGAEAAALVIAPQDGESPRVRSSWTPKPAEVETPVALAYQDVLARALGSDEVVVEPIRFHPIWHWTRESADEGFALVVPVRGGRGARGGLFAALGRSAEDLDGAVEIASDYAALAAVCLRDATEVDEIRELASRDALTGCLNRAATLAEISREFARCERHRRRLCVCFLDIDQFKRVNDVHGHLVGDRVLHQIGDALRGATRRYDTVGRFGGDEFLVVMPETEGAEAERVARRLVEAVGDVRVDGSAMSASFGISEWEPGKGTNDILQEADRVLLGAKGAPTPG
jgi:diguanylate cyclase (GGDEF)-like protein